MVCRNGAAGVGSKSGVRGVLEGKVKRLERLEELELDPDAVLHGIFVADEWCRFEVESESEDLHGYEPAL